MFENSSETIKITTANKTLYEMHIKKHQDNKEILTGEKEKIKQYTNDYGKSFVNFYIGVIEGLVHGHDSKEIFLKIFLLNIVNELLGKYFSIPDNDKLLEGYITTKNISKEILIDKIETIFNDNDGFSMKLHNKDDQIFMKYLREKINKILSTNDNLIDNLKEKEISLYEIFEKAIKDIEDESYFITISQKRESKNKHTTKEAWEVFFKNINYTEKFRKDIKFKDYLKDFVRKVSKRYHPDKNQTPQASKIMQVINDAREILEDSK